MKRAIGLILAGIAAFLPMSGAKCENPPSSEKPMPEIRITIGDRIFSATLENTRTAAEFAKELPLTLRMNELNGNEKYIGLPGKLSAAPECPGRIRSGDLMLYGRSTLVLFYESFPTSYSYTRIGKITAVKGLKDAVGDREITVKFESVKTENHK
jgi:hypothetical protein